jgi:hypothetical protein
MKDTRPARQLVSHLIPVAKDRVYCEDNKTESEIGANQLSCIAPSAEVFRDLSNTVEFRHMGTNILFVHERSFEPIPHISWAVWQLI